VQPIASTSTGITYAGLAELGQALPKIRIHGP